MPGLNPNREIERIRWYCLVTIDAGRPEAVRESLILRTLQDSELDVTATLLKRELDYLEERQLIHVYGRGTNDGWSVKLTSVGIDLVDYSIPCNPGIARPPRE